jgi:hypothetical protein
MKEWADRLRGWASPEEWHQVVIVDAQVAGEPLGVVLGRYAEVGTLYRSFASDVGRA